MHQWPMTQHVTQTLLWYQSSQHHYGYVMRCKPSPLSVSLSFHSHDGGTAQLGSSEAGAARGSIHWGRSRQGLPYQHTVLIFQISFPSSFCFRLQIASIYYYHESLFTLSLCMCSLYKLLRDLDLLMFASIKMDSF